MSIFVSLYYEIYLLMCVFVYCSMWYVLAIWVWVWVWRPINRMIIVNVRPRARIKYSIISYVSACFLITYVRTYLPFLCWMRGALYGIFLIDNYILNIKKSFIQNVLFNNWFSLLEKDMPNIFGLFWDRSFRFINSNVCVCGIFPTIFIF